MTYEISAVRLGSGQKGKGCNIKGQLRLLAVARPLLGGSRCDLGQSELFVPVRIHKITDSISETNEMSASVRA